jgi:hypothetical protein
VEFAAVGLVAVGEAGGTPADCAKTEAERIAKRAALTTARIIVQTPIQISGRDGRNSEFCTVNRGTQHNSGNCDGWTLKAALALRPARHFVRRKSLGQRLKIGKALKLTCAVAPRWAPSSALNLPSYGGYDHEFSEQTLF